MAVTTQQTTLISVVYFRKFAYTTPLVTALLFTGFVMVVDFIVVGLLINRRLEMFTSRLGTWIPFGLIFAATYLTGMVVSSDPKVFQNP